MFVCSCGINIAGVVDVEAVADYARTLPHVVCVENNLFACSADTQVTIAARIKELNLTRIVIAACATPSARRSANWTRKPSARWPGAPPWAASWAPRCPGPGKSIKD